MAEVTIRVRRVQIVQFPNPEGPAEAVERFIRKAYVTGTTEEGTPIAFYDPGIHYARFATPAGDMFRIHGRSQFFEFRGYNPMADGPYADSEEPDENMLVQPGDLLVVEGEYMTAHILNSLHFHSVRLLQRNGESVF